MLLDDGDWRPSGADEGRKRLTGGLEGPFVGPAELDSRQDEDVTTNPRAKHVNWGKWMAVFVGSFA
ncbi:hypothetical protein OG625_14495 [Streptomyces sp. NBC_01351]|uniref:hypothetical protein n=1 Tax=Streptomyces sp. NBC_01351 TaxID=2903833 RepID=UPI002E3090F4|nr:hypothetical protein [Streptomyces sp. NBC_01351]